MAKKVRSFEEAEHVAFSVFEEYHTTQAERKLQFYINQMRQNRK